MYGTGGQKRVSDEFVRNFILALPAVEEQEEIAAFLDSETAKIDALIEEQWRLVELLKEKRQATISHAVTQGLNEGIDKKSSGTDWLGTIPALWSISPIIHITEKLSYGFTNPMPITDEGPLLLTANDIGDGEIDYESARKTSSEAYTHDLTEKSRPKLNDILITKDGTLGRVSLHDGREACINQSIASLRVNPRFARPAFVALALQSALYKSRMIHDAGGTTIKHIYISRLAKMQFAYPGLAEQDQILTSTAKAIEGFANLIGNAECLISVLQERRSALISAAVTGKIDVRGFERKDAA
jgi:type I restriction enzyme S subunit